MKKTITALLLLLSLVLSACSMTPEKVSRAVGQLTGQTERAPTFREMVYTRPDMDALKGTEKEICSESLTQTDPQVLLETLSFYYNQVKHCQTMYHLADIRHSLDLSDQYYKEEYEFCAQAMNQISESTDTVGRALAQSPLRKELEAEFFGDGFFDQYLDDQGQAAESVWSETLLKLLEEETRLEANYYDVLSTLAQNQTDPDYTRKLAEALVPIYAELVQVRQAMARETGYADYESFAWDWFYHRDYTPREAEAYVSSIQENLVPLYLQLWNSDFLEKAYSKTVSQQQVQSYVKSAAEHMGGIAEKAWQVLADQELFDLSAGENKYAGSFELYLASYEVPFIFFYPYGDITDYIGFSHEFGHFINDYMTQESYLSIDNAEVLSQAMEYLATSYSKDTSGSTLKTLQKMVLANSLSTYIDQAAYHRFESRVYKLTKEELTLENLNAIYAAVMKDFGVETGEGMQTGWAEVPHFFTEPFYVLSYVVSNDIAMQIYEKELETGGDGLELFDALSMQWEDEEFGDLLSGAGIVSPFEPQRMDDLKTCFQTKLIDQLD